MGDNGWAAAFQHIPFASQQRAMLDAVLCGLHMSTAAAYSGGGERYLGVEDWGGAMVRLARHVNNCIL
jgi:hypothetical protein